MYDSVKKTKIQLSQDIFPAEARESRTKNRDEDALVKGEISPLLLLVWRGESVSGQEV
ncbi:MAG: hypothetical protein GWN93_19980 [Deltaproteobacteria bacterium]|nr:hypothetical protein [Deltaproteobacteria bacterium]